jgi:hypothetical protein
MSLETLSSIQVLRLAFPRALTVFPTSASKMCSQVPLAHAYNPSYSGGKAQEDWGSKSAWANSSWDPISKKTHHRIGLESGSRYRPWVQTPVLQTQTKKKHLNTYVQPTCCMRSYVLKIHLFGQAGLDQMSGESTLCSLWGQTAMSREMLGKCPERRCPGIVSQTNLISTNERNSSSKNEQFQADTGGTRL